MVINHLSMYLQRFGCDDRTKPFLATVFYIIIDEMMSTENFGKIRDGEYSNFSRYKG